MHSRSEVAYTKRRLNIFLQYFKCYHNLLLCLYNSNYRHNSNDGYTFIEDSIEYSIYNRLLSIECIFFRIRISK